MKKGEKKYYKIMNILNIVYLVEVLLLGGLLLVHGDTEGLQLSNLLLQYNKILLCFITYFKIFY